MRPAERAPLELEVLVAGEAVGDAGALEVVAEQRSRRVLTAAAGDQEGRKR
jgi:hypothetical protein